MRGIQNAIFEAILIKPTDLDQTVAQTRPDELPQSPTGSAKGSAGRCFGTPVFLTNGKTWKRQRAYHLILRFEGGPLAKHFPAILGRGQRAAAARLAPMMANP